MANADIYRYTAELQYVKGNTATTIDSKNIKNIVIDSNYDQLNMPLLFLSVAIDKNLLDDMVKNSDTALINLTIYKYIDSDGIGKTNTIYIREQFVYFITDDLNERREIDNSDEMKKENQDLLKLITIGLLKLDWLNKNKKQFNGVISNTTMINMIYYCAGHLPMLIEPLTYNKSLDQIILPPINSVSKALDYLNKISAFYSTQYRFFMDFDTVYLVSSSGTITPKKGDHINSIIINIGSTSNVGINVQGMYTDKTQKAYIFNINTGDFASNINKASQKSFNTISAVTTKQSIGDTELGIKTSSYIQSKSTLIRLPNDNTNLLGNIKSNIENNSLIIELNKNDLDSSVLTINREFMIKTTDMDESYRIYDGKYILSRKRELFLREDETFRSNVMLTLKKLNA